MSIEFVIEAIRSKRCLPFLGAGASAGYSHDGKTVPGIPLGGTLAKSLADQCDYTNGATYDLSKVAEHFVFHKNGRRDELEQSLCSAITAVSQPRPIHTVLAQLRQIKFVITSNYDQLLEHEFQTYGRQMSKHYYDAQNPKTAHYKFPSAMFMGDSEVVLHKMHGTIEAPRSMVITQSDYIRYLARLSDKDRGMPDYIRTHTIPNFTLLFLGYSLEDWNFRVIWEGVLSNYEESGVQIESYAIVRESTAFQRNFWMKRNVTIIDLDLTALAVILAKEFNLAIPQLRVQKSEGDAAP